MKVCVKLVLAFLACMALLVGCAAKKADAAQQCAADFLVCYYSYNKDGRYDTLTAEIAEAEEQFEASQPEPGIHFNESIEQAIDQYYQELAALAEETLLDSMQANQLTYKEEAVYAEAQRSCEVAEVAFDEPAADGTRSFTLTLKVSDAQNVQEQTITGDIRCTMENEAYQVSYFHERTRTPTAAKMLEEPTA